MVNAVGVEVRRLQRVPSRDWILVLLLPGVTLAIVTRVLRGRRSWAAQRK